MIEEMSEEEFIGMTNEQVKELISRIGSPRSVEVVPDATRRTGIIYDRMRVDHKDFEKNIITKLSIPYLNMIKTIYDQGIKTIFMPGLTHGNLNRGKKYIDSVIEYGLKAILTGEEWLEFYKQYDIKVCFYGDFQYLNEITSKFGHENVMKWCERIRDATKNNSTRRLFWGFACSNSYETFRIIELSIEFFRKNNTVPSQDDIKMMYYGEHVDNIDIFIRPGEIRDSDCQPPLIGGNAQLYFPISPLTELEDNFFRRILYDYLFCRVISISKKQYIDTNLKSYDVQSIEEYYNDNRKNIIGLGKRVSHFWLPKLNFENNSNLELLLNDNSNKR